MSVVYPLCKQALLSAGINFTSDDIKAALVSAAYTYSAAHQYLSDTTGVVGTAVQLTSPTVALGVFNAANPTFPSVTGAAVTQLIIYKDTGVPTTSPLIANITGVSVTPNGGSIIIDWDTGANKIFAL